MVLVLSVIIGLYALGSSAQLGETESIPSKISNITQPTYNKTGVVDLSPTNVMEELKTTDNSKLFAESVKADTTQVDEVFKTLIINRPSSKDAEFTIYSPYDTDISIKNLRMNFKTDCGSVRGYKVYVRENRTLMIPVPQTYEICTEVENKINSTKDKVCSYLTNGSVDKKQVQEDWYETGRIIPGTHEYKIKADISYAGCWGKWGYAVEWVPEIIYGTTSYEQTRWAWWNATWTKRYPVNATELAGYSRTYDPALINLTAVTCADANKLDARFIDTSDNEIPSYVTSDGLLAVPYLNITANTNTLVGYVFCDASGIGRADYGGGLQLLNYSAGSAMSSYNITLTNYGTGFGFYPVWSVIKTPEGMSWTAYNLNNSAWQKSQKALFGLESTETFPANGTCAILDNSSIYIKVKCTPTNNVDYNFNYYMEFFDNSQMFHRYIGEYVSAPKKFGLGTMTSLLGSNDPRAKYSSSASAFTEADGGSPSSGTMSRGIFAFYATATPKWSMITVYNESKISSITGWQSYLRTSANDPQGCFAGNSYNCNTPQLNISQMTRDANMWLGFIWTGTDTAFNQTYAEKIYPVKYTIGTEEAATNSCTYGGSGNWAISMADNCNIQTNYNVLGNITFTGTGTARFNSTMNVSNIGDPGNGNTLYIDSACAITIEG